MRGAVLSLVALCGCNAWFGLDKPIELPPVDARYFDRPADAPASCPTNGDAPTFLDVFHQLSSAGCTSYSPAEAGFALAVCDGKLSKGPLEGPFAPVTYTVPTSYTIQNVRLAPEGDMAFVFIEGLTTPNRFDVVVPDGTGGNWTRIGAITTTVMATNVTQISTPTRGPERHVVVVTPSGQDYELIEYVGSGATWQVRDRYIIGSVLQAQWIPAPMSLSSDGLRLVFRGVSVDRKFSTFYSERADLTSRFGVAKLVSSVPSELEAPFLTDNCERMYFTAVNRVFYVSQY